MRCLTGARFNMVADILRQGQDGTLPDTDEYGEWVNEQDPLTHEIIRVWVPIVTNPDDPSTPTIDEEILLSVPCMARGIVEGGIRVAGTTERFVGEGQTALYESVDYIRLWFPANYVVTKRDRITNIRNRWGQILWKDEETDPDATAGWRATEFEVLGVTPLPDYRGKLLENMALLQKAEVYSA